MTTPPITDRWAADEGDPGYLVIEELPTGRSQPMRAAGPGWTWEDLGFVQDRSGRWCPSVVRAGGHHYDPHQHRDRKGRWTDTGEVHVPDGENLFETTGDDWDRYEQHYDVQDESDPVGGLTAISMTNGDTQVSYDAGGHRYVIADGTPDDLRSLAQVIDGLLADQDETLDDDEIEADNDGLTQHERWGGTRLDSMQIGYDPSGDFRFTYTDSKGRRIAFPELSAEDAARFADALDEQADVAEGQL